MVGSSARSSTRDMTYYLVRTFRSRISRPLRFQHHQNRCRRWWVLEMLKMDILAGYAKVCRSLVPRLA